LTSVDHETDTCALSLDVASGGITGEDINRETTLADVPIEYMTCNSSPFESGDRVVVEFTGNAWAEPVVIGFESHPKACAHDYVVITSKARPWDPDTLTTYEPDQWSIVWDTGTGRIAEQIPASATPGDFLSFPCRTEALEYWESITDARADNSSLSQSTYSEPDYASPWTDSENWGVEIYPEDMEGTLCNGHVYNYWQIGKYNYSTFAYDKFKWTSLTNVTGTLCSRAVQWFGTVDRWVDESEFDILVGWSDQHKWMKMNSPIGDFEDFVFMGVVNQAVFYHLIAGTTYGYYHPAIVAYYPEWWGDVYPRLTAYPKLSANSQLQIYIHHLRYSQHNWTGEGGPTLGDPWVYSDRYDSKIQIHAGSSYHPDDENNGAMNADPLSMERNADLEAALLNLIKTQLVEEDAAAGQDWSFWQLDTDHNPAWPGPGGAGYYDAAATETYQLQLCRWIEFDIEFREYPEE
jgi:hypothetical protein